MAMKSRVINTECHPTSFNQDEFGLLSSGLIFTVVEVASSNTFLLFLYANEDNCWSAYSVSGVVGTDCSSTIADIFEVDAIDSSSLATLFDLPSIIVNVDDGWSAKADSDGVGDDCSSAVVDIDEVVAFDLSLLATLIDLPLIKVNVDDGWDAKANSGWIGEDCSSAIVGNFKVEAFDSPIDIKIGLLLTDGIFCDTFEF